MNWDNISSSRRMGIYDEFTSAIKSCANVRTLAQFFDKLCAKMAVRSIKKEPGILPILEENHPEIMRMLRQETQYLVIMMRVKIEEKKLGASIDEDIF